MGDSRDSRARMMQDDRVDELTGADLASSTAGVSGVYDMVDVLVVENSED